MLLLLLHSLKWLYQPGLGQVEARSPALHLGLSVGIRSPSIWAICYCFPRSISRKLGCKWSSQDYNWHYNLRGWYCKWQLNPQHHNTSPGSYTLLLKLSVSASH